MPHDLPSASLLSRQAARLAPSRSRALRRLGVARLGPVLDLGAGTGAVTTELVRRSRGPVVALDRRLTPLRERGSFEGALRIVAEGTALPFRSASFALVHAQLVFLWQEDAEALATEAARVLRPGGTLLAIEPDYGGMLEWPETIALGDVWESALLRAGADPRVGRKLAPIFHSLGLRTRVDLLNAPSEPDEDRFALLEGLPLTDSERGRVNECRLADRRLKGGEKMVHLPYLLTSASRP